MSSLSPITLMGSITIAQHIEFNHFHSLVSQFIKCLGTCLFILSTCIIVFGILFIMCLFIVSGVMFILVILAVLFIKIAS